MFNSLLVAACFVDRGRAVCWSQGMTVRRARQIGLALTVLIAVAAAAERPAPRAGHALVYDERGQRVLLINGDHDLNTSEVWSWSRSARRRSARSSSGGTLWRLIDTTGPHSRTLAGVAYDTRRGLLVMQGGIGPGDVLYGDTQEWDGVQWRQLSESGGPGIRNHHAMVFDQARGVIVLFGGQDRDIALQNDTWTWNGETWTRVATSGPPARVHHAMVYDEARQRVLLYGGVNQQGDLSDFWEWDGTAWNRIDAQGPGPRVMHRMAFHSALGRVFLFGGFDADNRVWLWDGSSWTRFEGTTPTPRALQGMAYDTARRTIVVFGGFQDNQNLGDTWELIGNTWVRVDSGFDGAQGRN
jgi:hypothetical protein